MKKIFVIAILLSSLVAVSAFAQELIVDQPIDPQPIQLKPSYVDEAYEKADKTHEQRLDPIVLVNVLDKVDEQNLTISKYAQEIDTLRNNCGK